LICGLFFSEKFSDRVLLVLPWFFVSLGGRLSQSISNPVVRAHPLQQGSIDQGKDKGGKEIAKSGLRNPQSPSECSCRANQDPIKEKKRS
jgi:hypothetical protein